MINEHVLELLQDTNVISKDYWREIKRCGIRSGSWMFGGYNKKTSDRDILLPHTVALSFELLCSTMQAVYAPGEYRDSTEQFNSCYIKTKIGNIYNLLFFHDDYNFQIWKYATECMIAIWNFANETNNTNLITACEVKSTRVALFEAFKGRKTEYNAFDAMNEVPF